MKILIIEDDKALRESMVQYLEHQGFVCESVNDFKAGLEKVNEYLYACIVVDIGLPYGSGLDIVKELKYMESKAGIIIVSAKNSLEDKLNGLDLGADDYLCKPFYLSELTARINAIIRRRTFSGSKTIKSNEIKLEVEARRVTVNGKPVDFTNKEYQSLESFTATQRRMLLMVA